jgi:hypothetical protein
MFSESFKYFFAVTVLNLSSIGLALLAHIYSKYAICKSCENSRRHRSKIRTSPGKHRFRSRFIRTIRRGMVTGSGWTPTEIRTSEGVGRPWVLVPSFLFSTPPGWRSETTHGIHIRPPSHPSLAMSALLHASCESTTSDWLSHRP